jgi:hypothetical protein
LNNTGVESIWPDLLVKLHDAEIVLEAVTKMEDLAERDIERRVAQQRVLAVLDAARREFRL